MTDTTNQNAELGENEVEDTIVEESTEELEFSEDDGQSDDQGYEEELEEVELEDGKRYSVPKDIKDRILMHKDYTQKTQEIAETRRQLEAKQKDFEQVAQYQQENIKDVAKAMAIDERLTQFKQVDWNSLSEQDPVRCQQLLVDYQMLRDQKSDLVQQIQIREGALRTAREQETAQQIQQTQATLRRDIPEWGEKTADTLAKFGREKFGFPESVLSADILLKAQNAPEVKLLHMAYLAQQMLDKAKAPTQKAQEKPVTTLRSVNARVNKNPAKMSFAEYQKWRKQG